MTYGRQVLSKTGRDVRVFLDRNDAQFKVGGITLDWSLFAAAGADVVLVDQTPLKSGEKFARFGQILCQVTQSEIQTIDLSGDDDPTGGTFSLTVLGETLTGLAWNISAADLQTAIRAINHPYAGRVTVGKASFVYTLTFPIDAGNVAAAVGDTTGLTGGVGDTFAITVTTSTAGLAAGGKFGPYDPNATDGRQTLSRGRCFILNHTVKETGYVPGVTIGESDHPQVGDGGTVWKDRVLMTSGAHTLAAGPTVTEFEAAFPRIGYAQ
jgi:hypothetical protein